MPAAASSLKCIALDLDGTLWDGALLEDGVAGVRARAAMMAAMRELDRRGIIFAAVSKNPPELAEEALKSLSLDEFFVARRFGWGPKSEALREVAAELNLGLDSFAFCDDRPEERAEVARFAPEVLVMTPEEFPALTSHPRVPTAVTTDAGHRRHFYRAESARRQAEDRFDGSHDDFISRSGLSISVRRAEESIVARLAELTRRTNQLNFTGHRYTEEMLRELLGDPTCQVFAIAAIDRFGPYGLVGLVIVHEIGAAWEIRDMMYSCRIQAKGIERSVLHYLLTLARDRGIARVVGYYRATERNRYVLNIYPSFGFVSAGEDAHGTRFLFDPARQEPPAIGPVRIGEIPMEVENLGMPFISGFVRRHLAARQVNGLILDIGAGWDGVLGEGCDAWLGQHGRHVRLDLEAYPKLDVIGNADQTLPIRAGGADCVLCLEVLEHTRRPWQVMSEIIRALKPGGLALLSAPFNHPLHAFPDDHWRFTPQGLRLLAEPLVVEALETEGPVNFPERTVLMASKGRG